ncbi:Ataxin-2 [Schizosaccharomyces pombe]
MATRSVSMKQTSQRAASPNKTQGAKKWSAVAARGSKIAQSATNDHRNVESIKVVPENRVRGGVAAKATDSSSNVTSLASSEENVSSVSGSAKSSNSQQRVWKTDVAISAEKRTETRQRELRRWMPDPEDAGVPLAGLEESTDNVEWDQFATNEKLFGVKSHFDEDLYTSRIDRSHPKYKEKEQEADRIAKEIEGTVTNNIHIAEERGLKVDDSGLDEEDLYSGVHRSIDVVRNYTRSNAYNKNNKDQKPKNHEAPHQHPQQKVVPPDDPAIVSHRHLALPRAPGPDSRAAERFFNARRKAGPLSRREKEGQIKEFMQFSQSLKIGSLDSKQPSSTKSVAEVKVADEKQLPDASSQATPADSKEPRKEEAEKPVTSATEVSSEKVEKVDGNTSAPSKEEEKPSTEPEKSSVVTQGKETTGTKLGTKLNAKAISFKPNVAAPVFTPGKFTIPSKPAPVNASRPMMPQQSNNSEASIPSTTPQSPSVVSNGENKPSSSPVFFNGPVSSEKEPILDNFNVLKNVGEEHQGAEQIDKPFSCPPTWNTGPNSLQQTIANSRPEGNSGSAKKAAAANPMIPSIVLPNGAMPSAMPMYPTPTMPYIPVGYPVPGYTPYMRNPSQHTSVAPSPNGTPTSGNSSTVGSPMIGYMAPQFIPPYAMPQFPPSGNGRGASAPATYFVPQMGGMMAYTMNGVPPMYGQYAPNNGMMNMHYPMYGDSRRSNSQRSFNSSNGKRSNVHKNNNASNTFSHSNASTSSSLNAAPNTTAKSSSQTAPPVSKGDATEKTEKDASANQEAKP